MDLFSELKERGVIYQATNEKEIGKILQKKETGFFIGFDPTAASLHIGNLFQIITMKRLEKAGLKPIVLIGGATGLIGDPSGKSQERQLKTEVEVKKDADLFKKQLGKFFDFARNAKLVNNYDWLKKFSLIEFLRDIGKYFTVNEMIKKESVETRMQAGISFTEFSYMLLQAVDFLNLFKKYDCRLQIGGSDQWGNITAGIELIRKTANKEALGFTIPLVTTVDGKKMGKSESGAVWLDSKLTSPYRFYQFWVNTDDRDVIRFLNFYSFLSLNQIKELKKSLEAEPGKREAQKTLAREMTIFVHGKAAYEKTQKISRALFSGNIKNLAKTELEEAFSNVLPKEIEKFSKLNIVDFLVLSGVSYSKRQAREDIQNNAIEINGSKITDLEHTITLKDFLFGRYVIIKRGKRDYFFINIK